MELIKIINHDGSNLVSSRELHEFLEVKSRFNDWIENRISKYEFIEDSDYTKLLVECVRGQNKYDYIITIDMAKELSMVENNDKGRQARRYFIECEKKLNNPLAIYEGKSRWDLILLHAQAEKEKEQLAIELKVAQPKVEYHDKVLNSSSCYTTTQIAKEVEMTARGLNTLLMQMGVQFKQSKQWHLSSKYQGNGYTRVRTHVTEDGQTRHSTVWTERGRAFVIDILEDA